MPKLSVPAKQLEPPSNLPNGIYEVRFDGFKPAWSKGKDTSKPKTINLQPQMKVINNGDPELDGKPIFDNLNVGAGWIINDFCHAFGEQMVQNSEGNFNLPGSDVDGQGIQGPDNEPEKWTYNGPLLGKTGKIEVTEREYNGKKYTNVKRYICAVPSCQVKHSENLVKA